MKVVKNSFGWAVRAKFYWKWAMRELETTRKGDLSSFSMKNIKRSEVVDKREKGGSWGGCFSFSTQKK